MKVTFLGTGTSNGVPMLACSCPVCRSTDPHDKRYRSSILIEKGDTAVVIDTGYEFRLSAIRAGVTHLEGVLYTHSHADHMMGLDDLRVFTRKERLSVYGNEGTLDDIKKIFSYAFKTYDHYFGIPLLNAVVLEPYVDFTVGDITFTPIPLTHGRMDILGYRIGKFAYLTDVSYISDEAYEHLRGVEILAIGALRDRPHAAHFTFAQAEEAAKRIGVKECWFTHINHETSYEEINRRFGPLCQSAYDTMVLEIPE